MAFRSKYHRPEGDGGFEEERPTGRFVGLAEGNTAAPVACGLST